MRYLKAIYAAIRLQRLGGKISGEHKIQAVLPDSNQLIVQLPKSPDTLVPGVQSLFWNSREGHAIVKPLGSDSESVSFELVKAFRNLPKKGDSVWLSGWLGESPKDFGFEATEEKLSNGTIALTSRKNSSTWVIHVHGRNATMAETYRNFKQFSDLGFNQLFLAHETDAKPYGLGKKRSFLGANEWRQVELAAQHALDQGASEIVLFGWSLGAMFVGQFLLNSKLANAVTGFVLDSPLIDYPSTLRLQATLAGLDEDFGNYVSWLLTKSKLLRALGYGYEKLPSILFHVDIPGLVLFSRTDGYVSMERIDELSAANANLSLLEFANGKHCRLYNQDPAMYQKAVSDFLRSL